MIQELFEKIVIFSLLTAAFLISWLILEQFCFDLRIYSENPPIINKNHRLLIMKV